SPLMFLLIVSLILLILGTLTEVTSLIILLSPIFMPIATELGIDPVHFGMVLIMNFALANITPPVGLSLIAGCSITDRKMGIEETLPYILHVLAIVAIMVLIIIFFPAFSTFLPGLLKSEVFEMIFNIEETDRYNELHGGEGEVTISRLLDKGIAEGLDLFALVTVPIGASIGYHRHQNVSEGYYILSGDAEFTDADGSVKTVGTG